MVRFGLLLAIRVLVAQLPDEVVNEAFSVRWMTDQVLPETYSFISHLSSFTVWVNTVHCNRTWDGENNCQKCIITDSDY